MGYLTSYELEIDNSFEPFEIVAEFRKSCSSAEFALDENGETRESTKWYERDKDLIAFSKKHPNLIFILTGIGEEQPDMWKLYVKNGKSFKAIAKIVYEEFNPSKLK